jgi:hypothetical protein
VADDAGTAAPPATAHIRSQRTDLVPPGHAAIPIDRVARAGPGVYVVNVHVERAQLGVSMMFADYGDVVRVAFDPRRISEAAAIAMLCIRIPRLVGSSLRILHSTT